MEEIKNYIDDLLYETKKELFDYISCSKYVFDFEHQDISDQNLKIEFEKNLTIIKIFHPIKFNLDHTNSQKDFKETIKLLINNRLSHFLNNDQYKIKIIYKFVEYKEEVKKETPKNITPKNITPKKETKFGFIINKIGKYLSKWR